MLCNTLLILTIILEKQTTILLLESTVESCTQLQFHFKNNLSILLFI